MSRPWWPRVPTTAAAGWSRVLLLVDPELNGRCEDAVRVAAGLTRPGACLDVLAPVLIPLSTPLGAPPAEETDRAEVLLEHVERLAGQYGIRVRAHLVRGRSVRGMLREVVSQVGPEVAVLRCAAKRYKDLLAELGTALSVLVADRGDDRG